MMSDRASRHAAQRGQVQYREIVGEPVSVLRYNLGLMSMRGVGWQGGDCRYHAELDEWPVVASPTND